MPTDVQPVIERRLTTAAPIERLWRAITDPDEVAAWFGAAVDWDLRTGGAARFAGHDGRNRVGEITEVTPARRLRFRWWPDGPDGDDGASEVTYELSPRPDGSGSELVIEERPVAAVPSEGATPPAGGSCSAAQDSWTGWDGRMVGLWAAVAGVAGVAGVAASASAGRRP